MGEEFEAAYSENRADAVHVALNACPWVDRLATLPDAWEGTARALLTYVSADATPAELEGRGWPRSPNALRGELKRLAGAIRNCNGLQIAWRRLKGRNLVVVTSAEEKP